MAGISMQPLHSIATVSQAYKSYRPQTAVAARIATRPNRSEWPKKGFAVWEKTTMFGPDGAESFSTINEVVEFSQATLDASLFDVPAGYREVKDFASAFSTPSTTEHRIGALRRTIRAQRLAVHESCDSEPAPCNSARTLLLLLSQRKQENPVKKGLKSLRAKMVT